MENLKNNNYDLLLRLGFDRDFIDENKRLGLKERQQEERKWTNKKPNHKSEELYTSYADKTQHIRIEEDNDQNKGMLT